MTSLREVRGPWWSWVFAPWPPKGVAAALVVSAAMLMGAAYVFGGAMMELATLRPRYDKAQLAHAQAAKAPEQYGTIYVPHSMSDGVLIEPQQVVMDAAGRERRKSAALAELKSATRRLMWAYARVALSPVAALAGAGLALLAIRRGRQTEMRGFEVQAVRSGGTR